MSYLLKSVQEHNCKRFSKLFIKNKMCSKNKNKYNKMKNVIIQKYIVKKNYIMYN